MGWHLYPASRLARQCPPPLFLPRTPIPRSSLLDFLPLRLLQVQSRAEMVTSHLNREYGSWKEMHTETKSLPPHLSQSRPRCNLVRISELLQKRRLRSPFPDGITSISGLICRMKSGCIFYTSFLQNRSSACHRCLGYGMTCASMASFGPSSIANHTTSKSPQMLSSKSC